MELSKSNQPPPPSPQIRLGKYESTLVRKPAFGIFPWWPEEGNDWIHPEDVVTVNELLPGNKILCRTDTGNEFVSFRYGKTTFRAKSVMWLEVPQPDYEINDQVEIQSKLGKIQPKIATVVDVQWDRYKRRAEYKLARLGSALTRVYFADELRPTARLGEVIPARHLDKLSSFRLS